MKLYYTDDLFGLSITLDPSPFPKVFIFKQKQKDIIAYVITPFFKTEKQTIPINKPSEFSLLSPLSIYEGK